MNIPIYINISVQSTEIPPVSINLWMQKEDKDSPTWSGVRPCAPCPAVFTILDDPHTELNEQWQYYLCAINYGMTLEHVSALLGDERAFTNGTGVGERRNYILGSNLSADKNPCFDKVRTCSRATMTGEPTVDGKYLKVRTMDGKLNPPLKTGKSYPSTPQEAQGKFEDYLYNPRDNREMFFVANIVSKDGTVVQFPNGGLYSWMDNSPYVWLPYVSDYPVYYDMNELVKVSNFVSPYRRS